MSKPVTGETLLRNVAFGFYDEDAEEPNPACLWPSTDDGGQLSTDRHKVWDPVDSFKHRTQVVGLPSAGVIAVESDALLEHCAAPTVADPLVAGVDGEKFTNPAHALSDFSAAKAAVKAKPKKERSEFREGMLYKLVDGLWAHGPA
jgi:hypothetical protein